jgi:hypothetical protein
MAAVLLVGVHNGFQTADLDARVIINPQGNSPLPVLLFECISHSSDLTNFLQFLVKIEL